MKLYLLVWKKASHSSAPLLITSQHQLFIIKNEGNKLIKHLFPPLFNLPYMI